MRIVAGLAADQRADEDFLAARGLVGGQQLFHPGVVIDAVDDHDLGVGERLGGLGARLEQMRVLVGIGQDAGDGYVGAADLRGEVAIEVLRGDDLDGIGESGRGRGDDGQDRRGQQTICEHERDSRIGFWAPG